MRSIGSAFCIVAIEEGNMTENLQKMVSSALASLENGDPINCVDILNAARNSTTDLNVRKPIEKAKEEAEIGDPNKAESYLNLILANNKVA